MAAVVVLATIIMTALLVTGATGFLKGAAVGEKGVSPTFECSAWLRERQKKYAAHKSPCAAAAAAAEDARRARSGAPCPRRDSTAPASTQTPYAFYMASQGCVRV